MSRLKTSQAAARNAGALLAREKTNSALTLSSHLPERRRQPCLHDRLMSMTGANARGNTTNTKTPNTRSNSSRGSPRTRNPQHGIDKLLVTTVEGSVRLLQPWDEHIRLWDSGIRGSFAETASSEAVSSGKTDCHGASRRQSFAWAPTLKTGHCLQQAATRTRMFGGENKWVHNMDDLCPASTLSESRYVDYSYSHGLCTRRDSYFQQGRKD